MPDLVGVVAGVLFGSVLAIATMHADRSGHLPALLTDGTNGRSEDLSEVAHAHRPERSPGRRAAEHARLHAARPQLRDRECRSHSADESFSAPKPGIVVGVTNDPAARRALRWAFDVAIMSDALLIVVTAYSLPRAILSMDGTTYFDIHDAEATARWVQTRIIEAELHVELPNRHIHQVVAYGDPIAALIAESSDSDLLVVGRRTSRIRRVLTGSVSKGCANHAACPVVIVRTDKQAARRLGPIIGRHVISLIDPAPEVPDLHRDGVPAHHQQDHSQLHPHRHKH